MCSPVCELCKVRGIITPATQIHHADSYLNYEGDRRLTVAYDYSNLVSLCDKCHAFVHRNGTTHGIDIESEAKEYDTKYKNEQKTLRPT